MANFNYNALGQLASIAGPLGAVTQFVYDLAGRMARTLIGEDAKNYATGGSVKVANAGEDTADLVINIDSGVKQVKIFYKKKTDMVYQSFAITNPTVGENRVTLQGLSGDTDYDFEIQYEDNEGDLSYSRKYDFKTQAPEPPVIVAATVQTVSDTAASIKIDISKEIRDARIQYHVQGETIHKTLFTQAVAGADTNGLVFNLEGLRSGQNYDAEITITDRFGITSEIKSVSFKTTGALSPADDAMHATPGFGQVVATTTTQAFVLIENDKLSDPFAESYILNIYDVLGNPVYPTYQANNSPVLGKVIIVGALSSNSQYTYTLSVTSRFDIPVVSGSFRTALAGDTTAPTFTSRQVSVKDPTSLLFSIKPLEAIKTLILFVIDQVTQAVKKYYFFDLAANVLKFFLLDGLEAEHSYKVNWTMLDTSGNFIQYIGSILTTSALDETPPSIISNTVIARTETTAKLYVVTNEILKKLRVRYRIVGTNEWLEQTVLPTATAFDINLSGLLSGQSYEYQYILDDKSGNQLLTEWVVL